MWYHDSIIFFCYVDSGIFVGPEYKTIGTVIEEIRNTGLYIKEKENI